MSPESTPRAPTLLAGSQGFIEDAERLQGEARLLMRHLEWTMRRFARERQRSLQLQAERLCSNPRRFPQDIGETR